MHIANQNKRIEEMCKRINVCPKRAYDKSCWCKAKELEGVESIRRPGLCM